jgi:hypothetical protein
MIEGGRYNFIDAITILTKEYSSFALQQRFLSHLENLRVQPLLAKGMSKMEALHAIWDHESRLCGKCPKAHRSESNKIAFLRTAVIGNSWASATVGRSPTSEMFFQQPYTQLESAIQLKHEEAVAKRKDNASNRISQGQPNALSNRSPAPVNGIMFQRCGRRIRGIRKAARSPREDGMQKITAGSTLVM